ncbi:MAG: efflux RND transporter permease subunit [Burkholderiaceae bacterium]
MSALDHGSGAGQATIAARGEADPLGVSGRVAASFQRNAITPLLALVLLLLGLFAALVTPREEEPQIDVTMTNVMIPFPGASASDVESLVAGPAEQVLSQVVGLEHVYSVSRDGMALVTLQFEVGVARNDALVRVHETLNANSDWLPPGLGVGTPVVKPRGIDDVPVFAATLWSTDVTSGAVLEEVAHSIEQELKRVPGTRDVNIVGGPGRAVHVWLDPARMQAAGIGVRPVLDSLRLANLSLPSGDIIRDGQIVRVEAGSFLATEADVEQLMVGTRNGLPVFLRDVARVEAAPLTAQRYAWHMPGAGASSASGVSDETGRVGQLYPAVTIAVTKKAGENAVDVTRRLQARVDALKNVVIPANVEVTVARDYGDTAADKADKLIQKLAFATFSVIVLVALALGLREAVIVGVAVILTLTATLFASWAWGFTLNRVSLFALIFSIGILVDDAIVVVENIHRHRALEPGKRLWEIIPAAVDEVGGPTILATFTVIAALLPMAFVTGLMGPYMAPIPINASMGMLLSLAIAFVVTPWLSVRLMRADAAHGTDGHGAGGHGGAGWVGRSLAWTFGGALSWFVGDGRGRALRRLVLFVGLLAALAGSVLLVASRDVILKMLPFDNKSEFQVVVDMPPGTPVERTNAVLMRLAEALARDANVRDIQGYAGTAAPINFNGLVRQYDLRTEPDQGDLQVNLIDKHARSEQSHAIAQRAITLLAPIAESAGARMKVVEVPPGPPVLSPVVAEVYGPDDAGIARLARRLREQFEALAGMVAIDTSLRDGAARQRLIVDRARARALGISDAMVAEAARAALGGLDATYLHDGSARRAVPVRVALPEETKGGLDTLLTLPLMAETGRPVPLGEVVDVVGSERHSPIYHKNLLPVVYVVGDMGLVDDNQIDSPLYGLISLRADLQKAALPGTGELAEYFTRQPDDPWRQYAIKWDGEWQVTYETFRDMGIAYAVGLVLIYLLVVAQFRSYLTPLIIMAPIPLTVIGVMPGHALLGAQFTATSMIGMIALAGIIVRNSILLVDFIELEVRQGRPLAEAVVRSAQVRAQPILLTALAAMLGALFILDDPIFNGLAVALIFGILVSTILTLIVIPLFYYLFRRNRS